MRRVQIETQDSQNYDSFLDIVANLVGILLILIMVVGVRARNFAKVTPPIVNIEVAEPTATAAAAPPPATEIVVPLPPQPDRARIRVLQSQIGEQQQKAQSISVSAQELDANIRQMEHQARMQQAERNQLQLAISMAEKALQSRQSELGEKKQVQLTLAKQIGERKYELQQLVQQTSAVEAVVGAEKVVEHRPTPLAKTVFGKEDHFRIMNGYIVHVPLNEAAEIMRRDARNKLWKLENSNEITEIIGPINGFRVKYTVEKQRGLVQTPEGPRAISSAELRELDMVPESSTLGETVDLALQNGSEFAQRLDGLRPDETTITLWVYPDGFGEFRQIKSYLYQRGFLSAARPMEFGYLIGGSPKGTKSAAE